METLSGLAELHLTFSVILTNMWCVSAELHLIDDNKGSGSIMFDEDFLVCMYVCMFLYNVCNMYAYVYLFM